MNTPKQTVKHTLTRGLTLFITVLTIATIVPQIASIKSALADDGGYPWANATALKVSEYDWGYSPCPTNASGCMGIPYPYNPFTDGKNYGMEDPYTMEFRNCTSYVAWKISTLANTSGWGDAATWPSHAPSGSVKDPASYTPVYGDVAQWGSEVGGGHGHVAYVTAVDPTTHIATLAEYNSGLPRDAQNNLQWGMFYNGRTTASNSAGTPDHYIHLGTVTQQDNTVLEVKKLTQSDGTNEVIWAKNTDVNESWWNSSSNGIQVGNILHISQGDIKSFDIALYADGEHDLFTATAHNVWENWWYPGQSLHTTEILANIGNIRKIIKSMGPDGVTHQLYVLTDTGVYEYWWNSSSNGIQHGTIMTLANPVDEYKEIEADGTQALFVADQNYPYELHWGSGINGIQQTTFAGVSGITSLSYSRSSDGKHRLYIGASSGAIWEASWYSGSIGYWYMTGGSPVVQLQKWEDDSEQVLYEATSGGVFEYYWPTTSNTLSSDTIKGSLSSVHSFVRSTDPGGVQSVYMATGTNILESWWIPGGNGITTGTIE